MTRLLCQVCLGSKVVSKPRAAVDHNGRLGTIVVMEPCKACQQTGHVDGPPV